MNIQTILAREILDSRGNPTVEADVILENGLVGRSSVPSGASTGQFEAVELRDKSNNRYLGKGVLQAIENIRSIIAPALTHQPVHDQTHLDNRLCELDGTPNKARLGANAMLAVSLAIARASALANQRPLYLNLFEALQTTAPSTSLHLPLPLMNILNGGAHADNGLNFQEFMIAPIGASDFPTAVRMGSEIFHALKSILQKQGLQTAVGYEGGFAPVLRSHRHALDLISNAVHQAGYTLGKDIVLALDVAASEFFDGTLYQLTSENKALNADELIAYYQALLKDYPIYSIEDGLDQADWTGWGALTAKMGADIQLVGDDIFVTHTHLLQKGIEQHVANAILIKPNQVGTLTETIEAIKLAQQHSYEPIVSHRSGETEDTFIADLAVATGCRQIKTGSLSRTDRVAKYNQLLRIYDEAKLPFTSIPKNMEPK